MQDPRTANNTARRYYLNQLAAAEARAFDRELWKELKSPKVVEKGAMITLGFDGSEKRDHTSLIGTEVLTGYQWIVGYWEPEGMSDGEMRINKFEVNATVDAAFETWNVLRLYADPPYWQEQVANWEARYNEPGVRRVAEFYTTTFKRMARALLNYRQAISAGDLSHDGDRRFGNAIGNAFRHEQQFVDDNGDRMWTIEKERPDSLLKIDAAVSGCLSWQARLDAIAAGEANEEKDQGVAFYFPN